MEKNKFSPQHHRYIHQQIARILKSSVVEKDNGYLLLKTVLILTAAYFIFEAGMAMGELLYYIHH